MDIFKNSIYNCLAETVTEDGHTVCICFQPIDILKPRTGFCTHPGCRYSKSIVTCGRDFTKCEFDRYGDRKRNGYFKLPEDFKTWHEYWTFVFETNKKRGKDIL